MKEFDLEAAKAGAPVQTRDGVSVRIVCFDYKSENYPILGLVDIHGKPELIACFSNEGKYIVNELNHLDLFMAPNKKTGWVNIYVSGTPIRETGRCIYDTKEDALSTKDEKNYIDTIKIEWEE